MTDTLTPVATPDPEDTESFTSSELDEMLGAMLYLGGVHNALGQLLDVTSDDGNLELVEFVNHAPDKVSAALLAVTAGALVEVNERLAEVESAVSAALDSCAERIAAGIDWEKVTAADIGGEKAE